MPPKRKRTGYKPPRNPRDILIAVGSALAVIIVTVGLIWFFAPDDSDDSNPTTPVVPQTSQSSGPSNSAPSSTVPASTSATVPTSQPTP
jgi:hypothetical protein